MTSGTESLLCHRCSREVERADTCAWDDCPHMPYVGPEILLSAEVEIDVTLPENISFCVATLPPWAATGETRHRLIFKAKAESEQVAVERLRFSLAEIARRLGGITA